MRGKRNLAALRKINATVAACDVIEEVTIVATHSKTRRAVQRLRRLARRLRAAKLKKTRPSGTDNPT
jgi:hypothetical protein